MSLIFGGMEKDSKLIYLLDQVPLALNRFSDLESGLLFDGGAYLRLDGSYWNSCKLIPW